MTEQSPGAVLDPENLSASAPRPYLREPGRDSRGYGEVCFLAAIEFCRAFGFYIPLRGQTAIGLTGWLIFIFSGSREEVVPSSGGERVSVSCCSAERAGTSGAWQRA